MRGSTRRPPHIVVDGFLGEELNRAVADEALSLLGRMEPGQVLQGGMATVNDTKVNVTAVVDHCYGSRGDSAILSRLVVALWSERVRALLRAEEDSAFAAVELTLSDQTVLSAYRGGGRHGKHIDQNLSCTFNYMLAPRPGGFTGGELLLHGFRRDHGVETVQHRNDRLVIYPSVTDHEVLPVACQSDDPRDWRWTVQNFPKVVVRDA